MLVLFIASLDLHNRCCSQKEKKCHIMLQATKCHIMSSFITLFSLQTVHVKQKVFNMLYEWICLVIPHAWNWKGIFGSLTMDVCRKQLKLYLSAKVKCDLPLVKNLTLSLDPTENPR